MTTVNAVNANTDDLECLGLYDEDKQHVGSSADKDCHRDRHTALTGPDAPTAPTMSLSVCS